MPEGPFGFPRLSTAGPFSRKTVEEIKSEWGPCPDDKNERYICSKVKKHTLKHLEDRGVMTDIEFAYDVHSGCCDDIAASVYEDAVDKGISGVSIAVGWGPDGSGHTWIAYNGKHYDATDPQGVKDPNDLWFWEDLENFRVDEGDTIQYYQPE